LDGEFREPATARVGEIGANPVEEVAFHGPTRREGR
jgi:hypothetical protein